MGYSVVSPSMVNIRSSIFLHWEDARQFIASMGYTSGQRSEYAAFDSLEEAESYLIKGESDRQLLQNREAASTTSATTARAISAEALKRRTAKPDWSAAFPKLPTRVKATPVAAKQNSVTKIKQSTAKKRTGKSKSSPVKKKSVAKAKSPTVKEKQIPKNKASNKYETTKSNLSKKIDNDAVLVPSWDTMYERLVSHKAETDTLIVTKSDDKNLHAWVATQKKMLLHHFQGKQVDLSNEQITKLKTLGYGLSRPSIIRPSGVIDKSKKDEKWDEMLEKLKAYKEENGGSMSFPYRKELLSKPITTLKYWTMEQRREFKKLEDGDKSSNMTADRLRRLTAIRFDMQPTGRKVPWEQRLAQLRAFVEEHDHCRPPKNHPELGIWTSGIRQKYKQKMKGEKTSLTDERVNDLLEIGFVFAAGKTPNHPIGKKTWEERFEELLEFKELHGHTVVPQLSGTLGNWVRMQRIAYKKFKAGEKSTITAEKALKLSEIGFCFDASDRFKTSSSQTG
eukprot:CAMPEP_0183785432 /NCGR_PEP_ID=MMETSP0739-20130205/66501_1 /TAXON_ID=385413 /ORGANISM="Thalassiosira miniscula, Strain CCMP1093" /LENGTH=507 /DNA_ID=CAMNT_0026029435 /DNA_START=1 /DNA_END=1524 /DNA_ORIENTATION=-